MICLDFILVYFFNQIQSIKNPTKFVYVLNKNAIKFKQKTIVTMI